MPEAEPDLHEASMLRFTAVTEPNPRLACKPTSCPRA
jgi:hypothetical protein